MAADRLDAVPVRGHRVARQLDGNITAILGIRPFEFGRRPQQAADALGILLWASGWKSKPVGKAEDLI